MTTGLRCARPAIGVILTLLLGAAGSSTERQAGAPQTYVGSRLQISSMGPDGDPSYDAFAPAVAINTIDNEFLVVWAGNTPSSAGAFDIYGQRVDAATGAQVGDDDFLVSAGVAPLLPSPPLFGQAVAHRQAVLRWVRLSWPPIGTPTYPAVGDLDGDGRAEIVVGLGTGTAGWFPILDDASTNFTPLAWRQVNWGSYADGSTHPAVGDVDGDSALEIVVGLGPGSSTICSPTRGLTGWRGDRSGGPPTSRPVAAHNRRSPADALRSPAQHRPDKRGSYADVLHRSNCSTLNRPGRTVNGRSAGRRALMLTRGCWCRRQSGGTGER